VRRATRRMRLLDAYMSHPSAGSVLCKKACTPLCKVRTTRCAGAGSGASMREHDAFAERRVTRRQRSAKRRRIGVATEQGGEARGQRRHRRVRRDVQPDICRGRPSVREGALADDLDFRGGSPMRVSDRKRSAVDARREAGTNFPAKLLRRWFSFEQRKAVDCARWQCRQHRKHRLGGCVSEQSRERSSEGFRIRRRR
jgi:hypothetical protein